MKVLGGIAAAVVVLLVAPSTGVAQTKLPVGEAHGVRIVREHGAIVVVFTPRAAKLYKQIAGRLVTVDCSDQDPRQRSPLADTGGLDPLRAEGDYPVTMRAPKHRRKLVTGDRNRGMDYCDVMLGAQTGTRGGKRHRIGPRLIVSVPLTQPGAVFVDERSKAVDLVGVLVGASFIGEQRHLTGWPTYELLLEWGGRKAAKRIVKLASPTDTPPAEAFGYYSGGQDHVAVAILSKSGRRLFIELDGDVLSSNVTGYIFDFRNPRSP